MNKPKVVVICDDQEISSGAKSFASVHKLRYLTEDYSVRQGDAQGESPEVFALVFAKKNVVLRSLGNTSIGDIEIDFVGGKLGYRRRQQSFHSDLAKAIGVQSKIKPLVWDLTAGFGTDGFGLAYLGCKLKFIERNPVVHCLLQSGLARAREYADLNNDSELMDVLARIELIHADSKELLSVQDAEKPEVIYIDPMFPERSKSAKVKKGMQFFHQLVGADSDSSELIDLALQTASYRVVVKRPLHAALLSEHIPSHQIKGKTVRFDVYTLKSLKDWTAY